MTPGGAQAPTVVPLRRNHRRPAACLLQGRENSPAAPVYYFNTTSGHKTIGQNSEFQNPVFSSICDASGRKFPEGIVFLIPKICEVCLLTNHDMYISSNSRPEYTFGADYHWKYYIKMSSIRDTMKKHQDVLTFDSRIGSKSRGAPATV